MKIKSASEVVVGTRAWVVLGGRQFRSGDRAHFAFIDHRYGRNREIAWAIPACGAMSGQVSSGYKPRACLACARIERSVRT